MKTIELSLDEIYTLARTALLNSGSSKEMASIVADTVMRAERDGSHSHGLFRIPGYVASLISGKVNPNANPKVENVTPVLIRCDADNGYAPLAHARCLDQLADAAKTYGIAMAQITRSHHFAALWPETEALAEKGLVAFTCVSYMPMVAPFGAKEKVYGSNPISFAWPRKDQPPVVFDMATAAMAMGDIQIAARDGKELPTGTGLDKEGQPTIDPKDIDPTTGGGMILPFGGYKGSHIAMMVELLAGPLVGETVSFETARKDNKDGGPPAGGQFILAMSPEITSGSEDWDSSANSLFGRLKSFDHLRLPGERRHKNRQNMGPRSINAELVEKIQGLD
ncbi:MAG: delta1-piperideine-2-carboxylate reductase [Gammaproteobacteria bacterium]|jgi:delta1-piperideine-2-carboxylate reductase